MAHYLSQPRIEDPIWLEPNDISFLRTCISEAETAAQRAENQIEELRAQISELARHEARRDYHFSKYPRSCTANASGNPFGNLRTCVSPWRYLLQNQSSQIYVCSVWCVCSLERKVARATPRLWCRLDISFQKHHLGSDFGWVEGWITGCQGLPLDLYLDFYVIPGGNLEAIILQERGSEFLEYVLANFGHKIRVLHVSGHPSLFLPIFHLPLSSPLISLEHVLPSFIMTTLWIGIR